MCFCLQTRACPHVIPAVSLFNQTRVQFTTNTKKQKNKKHVIPVLNIQLQQLFSTLLICFQENLNKCHPGHSCCLCCVQGGSWQNGGSLYLCGWCIKSHLEGQIIIPSRGGACAFWARGWGAAKLWSLSTWWGEHMGTRIDHGPEQRPGRVAELSRYSTPLLLFHIMIPSPTNLLCCPRYGF